MSAKQQQYDINELEIKYHDITELYDLAEELLDTADSQFISNPEEQLELVEPLVSQVGDSADILTEAFCDVAKNEKSKNGRYKRRIETAMRKMLVAIDGYYKRVKSAARSGSQKIMNIADPIVEKIKRQVEVIIAIFVDFVDISLDRIMQKSQIEELKKRQEKIAIMLHDIGQDVAEHSR